MTPQLKHTQGEKAQLLKQMLPMLHDIHSIGVKLDDAAITDRVQK